MALGDVESLSHEVTRILRLRDRALLSTQQALDGLVGEFCVALLKCPDSHAAVSSILDTIPSPTVIEMARWLGTKRGANGEWLWPPVGAIGTPGGMAKFEPAGQDEILVYEMLNICFRHTLLGNLAKTLSVTS